MEKSLYSLPQGIEAMAENVPEVEIEIEMSQARAMSQQWKLK